MVSVANYPLHPTMTICIKADVIMKYKHHLKLDRLHVYVSIVHKMSIVRVYEPVDMLNN